MSTEDLDQDIDSKDELEGGNEEIDPIETQAREMGWVPEEEWDGDPDKWVPPKEFIFRGELFDRIKKQSRDLKQYSQEIQELKDAIRVQGEMQKKIADKEYKRIMDTLKQRKAEALEEGDHRTVIEIDDEIREAEKLKEENDSVSEEETSKKQNATPPEIVEWIEENPWYQDNVVMRGAADAIGEDYMNRYPNASASDLIKHVDKEIRKEFPEKFGKRRKAAKEAIPDSQRASSSGKNKFKSKFTVKDLSDEQRKIGETLVKSGAFEELQEYVDELANIGEIGE